MFFSCLCFSRQAVLSPVPVLFPDFCFSSLAHGSVLPQAHRVLTGVSVKESTTDFSWLLGLCSALFPLRDSSLGPDAQAQIDSCGTVACPQIRRSVLVSAPLALAGFL
jgi:hypothetical protein